MYGTNKTTVASSIDAFMYFLVKTLIKMLCKLYRYCSSCDSSKVCLWLTKQEILSKITADILSPIKLISEIIFSNWMHRQNSHMIMSVNCII